MDAISRRSVLGALASAPLAAVTRVKAIPVSFTPRHAEVPMLDPKQSGYLRHFHNIANRLPSDFTYMQSGDPDNIGDFDGYRWQLMSMMDSMTLAYQNYLPAAPGFFKADYGRLIDKLLRRECWNYWREMSRFSLGTPPAGISRGEGWWDPIVKENIFYSGLLTAMVAQYAYFFRDTKFDRVGALAFERPPYAKGPERIEYSLSTALDAIYWQLVENGYLGVACQPGMIFNSCPQMAINAFAYQDRRLGTNRAEQVIAGHRKAWEQLGGYRDGLPMPAVWSVEKKQTILIPWELGYFVFNTWNPEYFRSTYPLAKATVMRKADSGRLDLYGMKQYAASEKAFREGTPAPEVTRESAGGKVIAGVQGTVAVLLSEAGDPDLDILMRQVDTYLNPTWENGGLYYPRRDEDWDADGNVIGVAPTASHAYAHARINKRDGHHELFTNPLPDSRWEDPHISEVSHEVDVARAHFIPAENRLVATLRPPYGSQYAEVNLSLANARRAGQSWSVAMNDQTVASGTPAGEIRSNTGRIAWQDTALQMAFQVHGPTDLVIRWG